MSTKKEKRKTGSRVPWTKFAGVIIYRLSKAKNFRQKCCKLSPQDVKGTVENVKNMDYVMELPMFPYLPFSQSPRDAMRQFLFAY